MGGPFQHCATTASIQGMHVCLSIPSMVPSAGALAQFIQSYNQNFPEHALSISAVAARDEDGKVGSVGRGSVGSVTCLSHL